MHLVCLGATDIFYSLHKALEFILVRLVYLVELEVLGHRPPVAAKCLFACSDLIDCFVDACLIRLVVLIHELIQPLSLRILGHIVLYGFFQ